MEKITRTFKYKLKPNKAHIAYFEQTLNACRFLYNSMLDLQIRNYETFKAWGTKGKSYYSAFDLGKQITEAKQIEDWLKEFPADTLNFVAMKLDQSFKNFFRRVKSGKGKAGFPRFKGKHFYNSFKVRGRNIKLFDNHWVQLPKIGKVKMYKQKLPDELNQKFADSSIICEVDGWYLCLTFQEDKPEPLPANGKEIGMDLGVKCFAATSEGEIIENPKILKQYQRRLRVLGRSLARKKKGSYAWNQVKTQIGKLHLKIRRVRENFQHNLSKKLVMENESIVVEQLQIRNIVRKPKKKEREEGKGFAPNGAKRKAGLNKAILDVAWGSFCEKLAYKSEWHGRNFFKVPAQYTSRDCSECGHRLKELTLSTRKWACENCGTFHDRDINAAINIKKKGTKKVQSKENKKKWSEDSKGQLLIFQI